MALQDAECQPARDKQVDLPLVEQAWSLVKVVYRQLRLFQVDDLDLLCIMVDAQQYVRVRFTSPVMLKIVGQVHDAGVTGMFHHLEKQVGMPVASGAAKLGIPIPNSTSLIGVKWYTQAYQATRSCDAVAARRSSWIQSTDETWNPGISSE